MPLSYLFKRSPKQETQKKSNYSFSNWFTHLASYGQRLANAVPLIIFGTIAGATFGKVIGNAFGRMKDDELYAEDEARTLALAGFLTQAIARNMFDSCVQQGITLFVLLQQDFQNEISDYIDIGYMTLSLNCIFGGNCKSINCLESITEQAAGNKQKQHDLARTQNCFSPDNFLQNLHSIQAEAKGYPTLQLGCNYSEPFDLGSLNAIVTQLKALNFDNRQYCDYSKLRHDPVVLSYQDTGERMGRFVGALVSAGFGLFILPKLVKQTAPQQASTNEESKVSTRTNQGPG